MKTFCRYIVVGLALLLSRGSSAQIVDKKEMYQLGLKQDTLMLRHIYKGEYDIALKACTKKEGYFYKSENWTSYIKSRNDKAWIYHRMDSLKLLKETVFKNVELADAHLEKDNPEWIRAKEQVNSYYYILGDYKSALEIIKEVIPIKEKANVSKNDLGITYQNLGNAYNRLRDTDNALSSFKKSIKVMYPEGNLGLSSGERFNNIARTYNSRGELDSALTYLTKAELLFENIKLDGRFKKKKFDSYILLAETWLKKGDYKKAKYYLDLIEKLPLNTRETIIWNESRAMFFRRIGDYRRSKSAILEARQMAEESGIRNSPPSIARREIELAKTLIADNKDNEALKILQNNLHILGPKFENEDFAVNPRSEDLFDKPDALISLQEKARILERKYEEAKNLDFLKSSYDTYLTACDVIRDVRQGIRSADSKNDLSERSVSVYEEAIKVAFKLSLLTKDEEYILTAFKLAESNKAQLLLESLNENEASGYAGIPDSLSSKENDLKMYLAALEDRAVREGRTTDGNDEIFSLRQELIQFSSLLETSYPRYFQLKYNNEPIAPSDIQNQLLDDSTAMIEYFVGLEQIFVFLLTKNKIEMYGLDKDPKEMNLIGKLRNILNKCPGNNSPEVEYSEFVNTSREVYNTFVKEAIDKLPESINTLIVVPDDQINYIPFEVLLLENPGNKSSYSLEFLAYLFEDYAVNYNYSATLLGKVKSKETAGFKANFIGYAPTFAGISKYESRSAHTLELSKLKCNKDEVSTINSIIGGEERISEEATKENFLKEVNDYKIVHLATHAFVNQSDSKLNKIFLQNDFLSDVNLYNLELNTELVVLSACNTGSGELLKGEGVMNLARGFIHAGCSSTLMSMWSVDDCATADLMRLFYKGIKDGLQKDKALQRAKVDYLNAAKKTKLHPYYWAAFIPFGDMRAMELNEAGIVSYKTALGIFALLLLLTFYFYRRKKALR